MLVATAPGCVRGEDRVDLPEPNLDGTMSVEEAIRQRQSIRSFADRPLDLGLVSQILWAAEGATVDGVSGPTRAAPSAGGLYPCQLFVVAGRVDGLEAGVYRYLWQTHTLRRVRRGDHRRQLAAAALRQRFISRAPMSIVIAAVYQRTTRKYGERGALRYVPMDAGHMAQNVVLQSTALGLGATTTGAFYDQEVAGVLGTTEEVPLYVIPVGWPR
jgi:SagB-type dehydrogenase family enzyme